MADNPSILGARPVHRVVRAVAVGTLVALLVIALGVVGTAAVIGSGVRAATETALRDQPGDPVLALTTYVESADHSWRERNRAVWALGQLGDRRALSVLERHYTGAVCDHDRGLCQRELLKAIRLCQGAPNLPASLWR